MWVVKLTNPISSENLVSIPSMNAYKVHDENPHLIYENVSYFK
jgi:hypothetical protein